ncbi:MAG: PAS domain-containing sensor histidine kinase, partial [Rhodothermales bacterium]|nr:PAS domain-containing sensor histidine kinase [Rhodothermales bacterium]
MIHLARAAGVFGLVTLGSVQTPALGAAVAVPVPQSPEVVGVPAWMVFIGALLLGGAVLLIWYRQRRVLRQALRDRMLFMDSPEPMVLTDLRWKIVEANRAAGDLFGFAPEQAPRLTLRGMLDTKTELEPAALKEALDSGEAITFEARVEREGAEAVELAASTRQLVLQNQAYLLTAFHEITEHKDHQRLFKAFHRRLVEDLPIEVVVLAPQGQYLYANPRAIEDEELRAYMLGETDVEYCQYLDLHPEVALVRRSHRRRAVSTGQRVAFEETLPGKDGSYRTFTRIYNPVQDQSGAITAVVCYGLETTNLKQYQDEIVQMRAEAERMAELRETFLANISHEFRTPLTGILGFAQLLQDDVGPEQRGFVDIVLRNGRRLLTTLNAMLDLARLQSNYLEMHPTVFNLVEEVKQVAQSVSALAQDKGLYLRLRAARPEVLVRLDRSHLFRVLENLISNAIKFTHEGGVIVEVGSDPENAYVHVMDTGVGIRNEFLPFLFE